MTGRLSDDTSPGGGFGGVLSGRMEPDLRDIRGEQ